MPLVELMRAVQMLALEETILAVEGPRADEVANAVVHRIAKHGGEPQEQKEPTNRQIPPGREGSSSKQERIARQERRDDHTGFQKDDHKEEAVYPYSILLDDDVEVRIEMQKKIDQMDHHIPLLPQTIWHINDHTGSPMTLLAKQQRCLEEQGSLIVQEVLPPARRNNLRQDD